MKAFQYQTAKTPQEAVALLSDDFNRTKVIAGGMDIVPELKDHLIEPEILINIGDIQDLNYIREEGGGLRIGATATLTSIEQNDTVRQKHTALAEAAAVVGSPQIRNAGTLGGNLCQRPRCWYYRGEYFKCLKKGGAVCFTLTGRNKYNAILGGGPSYIVHPSDCAPALVALGATMKILGPEGEREMPIEEFFVLPTEILLRENVLKPKEIITEVSLPSHNLKSTYIKFRERDGYDWALSAAAVALELDGKNCKKASIVLGGVAPKPWRATQAEEVLNGKEINESLATEAANAAVEGAEPMSDNGYKIPLTKALVKRAIMSLVA